LEYSENFSGWSDELTDLHEEAAADGHPIDVLSRDYAIEQIENAAIDKPNVVMEIGCSSGYLIRDLLKKFPDATIIGADVVKAPLLRLARILPNVPLLRFDLLQNPLPHSCVNTLVMLNVLEHIEKDISALQMAFKLLKEEGVLIIEVPAGPYLYDSYDRELNHYRRYSAQELTNKLKLVGFDVVRVSHLGFFIFPIFALVKCINKVRRKNQVVMNQAKKLQIVNCFHLLCGLNGSFLITLIFHLELELLSRLKNEKYFF